MTDDFVFDFSKKKPIKCKHCNKDKGKHQTDTFNCPIKVSYARNFAGFECDKVFEPKETKK